LAGWVLNGIAGVQMIEAGPASHDKLPRFHARSCHGITFAVLKRVVRSLVELDRLVMAVLVIEAFHASHLRRTLFGPPHILANNNGEQRTAREIDWTSDPPFYLLRDQVFFWQRAFRVVNKLQ